MKTACKEVLPCPILRRFYVRVMLTVDGCDFCADVAVTETSQFTFSLRRKGATRQLRKDHSAYDALRKHAARTAAFEVYRDPDPSARLAVFDALPRTGW